MHCALHHSLRLLVKNDAAVGMLLLSPPAHPGLTVSDGESDDLVSTSLGAIALGLRLGDRCGGLWLCQYRCSLSLGLLALGLLPFGGLWRSILAGGDLAPNIRL